MSEESDITIGDHIGSRDAFPIPLSLTQLFLDKNTPIVPDTIRNAIVYEALAKSDDYLN